MKSLPILLLCFLFFPKTYVMGKDLLYPIKNYSTEDYQSGTQNWSVTEMMDGTLCFGNNEGLVVKNGTQWQNYTTINKQRIRAVISYNNKIYCGGGNEFGYFEKKFNGKFEYIPLSFETDISWGEIWRIKILNNKVYYQGGKAILVFDVQTNKLLTKIEISGIEYFNIINNRIFIQTKEYGFYETDDLFINKKTLVSPDKIAGKIIRYMAEGDGEITLFTLGSGIYKINNSNLVSCKSDFQENALKYQIYSVVETKNKIIIGTVLDGIYVLNKDLGIIRKINVSSGLGNNTILSLFLDSNSILWSGFDNGIGRIMINSPYLNCLFNKNIGTGYAFMEYKGLNYWGTNQGLFYSPKGSSFVNLIENTQGQVWCLKRIGNNLYCGHHSGLFKIEKNKAILNTELSGVMNLIQLRTNSNFYLAISYHQTSLLEYDPKVEKLIYKGSLPKESHLPRNALIDSNDYIWYSDYEKITKIKIDTSNSSIKTEEIYNNVGYKELIKYNNQIYLWENKKLLKYNKQGNDFLESEKLEFTDINKEEILEVIYNFEIEDLYKYFINPEDFIGHFYDIKNQLKWNVKLGYVYPDHYILNSNNGFINYKVKADTSRIIYKSVISEVKIKNRSESEYNWLMDTIIPYSSNNILFRFNSNGPTSTEYEYILIGYDQSFSSFSNKNVKEYTNLPEGDYIFKIRCKHGNQFSDYSTFEFSITPPFYRTKAAYTIYFISLVLFLTGFIILIKHIIKRRELKIETIRKKEIEDLEKNHRLKTIEKEKEMMALEKEKLESHVLHKQQELTNSTHNIVEKNNLLIDIKEQLESIYNEKNIEKRDSKLKKIFQLIDSNIDNDSDWAIFENYFLEIHQNFFENLKQEYPDLTQIDLKLCAYIKLNKTTKDIAALMNISYRGAETSRYRLRKKLGLEKNDSLFDLLNNF